RPDGGSNNEAGVSACEDSKSRSETRCRIPLEDKGNSLGFLAYGTTVKANNKSNNSGINFMSTLKGKIALVRSFASEHPDGRGEAALGNSNYELPRSAPK
ncbi:MAG TPA: hypothetical protein VKY92_25060, partial [Verrucomicrobiae bacterium]|nr:hypothetical protein [Verrucomicrobiae bacterium]